MIRSSCVRRLHVVQTAADALVGFFESLDANPSIKPVLEAAFLGAIDRHFQQFRLTDEEIEKLVIEVWRLM